MHNSPDSLSEALRAWRVQPPRDPAFRPAVWQRIHQAARDGWVNYVRDHRLAWGLTAAVAVIGAGWTGHTAAQARLESSRHAMAETYLVELDPRVQAKLRP